MQERLQKIISRAGIASRREAEKLITAGRVTVNGVVQRELGTKVELPRDKVRVDGKPIAGEKKLYILMHKPRGVVTTCSDPQGRKTVIDLIPQIQERVYPVGRLDYNTSGLLILTNDGDFAQGLTHPSHQIDKTYIAKVVGIPAEEKLDLLRMGVKLADGVTAPAKTEIIDIDPANNVTALQITIHEGKNRQIRRMCEAIGHPVKQLQRAKYAFLTLEGLRRGQYRSLTPDEVKQFQKLYQA